MRGPFFRARGDGGRDPGKPASALAIVKSIATRTVARSVSRATHRRQDVRVSLPTVSVPAEIAPRLIAARVLTPEWCLTAL